MRGESICGHASQPRRMNGCDGAVCVSPVCAKQMKFPLNDENVNQEKDNRSVVLTVSLARWFGLRKENRANVLLLFFPHRY